MDQGVKILLGILFIFAPELALAKAGDGDWISSGGDAVLCFASAQEAEAAEAEILRDGLISDTKVDAATSVHSLDLFAAIKPEHFQWARLYTSFAALKENRMQELQKQSPVLELYLRVLEKDLELAHWKSENSLKEIDDSLERNLFRARYPLCVMAQVIERRSLSQKNKTPRFEMLHRPRIWQRLAAADQVTVYFHELYYSIGREIGVYAERRHQSSGDSMYLVRATMSHSLLSSRQFRALVNKLYGDYLLLFTSTIKQHADNYGKSKGPNQATRLFSYQAFIAEAREFIAECNKYRKTHPASPGDLDCLDFAMHPQRIERYLSTLPVGEASEQAFAYLAVHVWDMGIGQINSEHLMSWTLGAESAAPTAAQKKILKHTCDLIQLEEFNELPWSENELPIRERAIDYCQRLGF